MKLPLSLLVALFATSNALETPIKRQSSSFVTDGSFESVPKSDKGHHNFNGGDWTYAGRATLFVNVKYKDEINTPYGKKFTQFADNDGSQTTGTVTQQLQGLSKGTLTLSYAYRYFQPPYTMSCYFTVALGSKTIDSLEIPALSNGEINFRERAKTFQNTASSGALTFKVVCADEYGYDIHLDNIAITD